MRHAVKKRRIQDSNDQQNAKHRRPSQVDTAADVLHVEHFFESRKPAVPHESRYALWEVEIRKCVRQRGGTAGVRAHLDFTNKVLRGLGVNGSIPTDGECLETCRSYIKRMKAMYPELILDPYILNEDQLQKIGDEVSETKKRMEDFKLLSRRFIIWRPSSLRKGIWDDTLNRIWVRLYGSMASMPYGEIEANFADACKKSCIVTTSTWTDGELNKTPIDPHYSLEEALLEATGGLSNRKIYFTDGTLPNYKEKGIPEDSPGLSCVVNDAANSMLPKMLRSNRTDSLLNLMKVESSGIATFTFFMPLGCGANMTAFHFETKRIRSLNCGSGDVIIQPLATEYNLKKFERVHTAIFGRFRRSNQILPLEMYLEEGIKMVVYMRDKDCAECVELPILSNHAFISYASVLSKCPPYKMSCNDMSIEREPLAAYLLEQISLHEGEDSLGGELQKVADSWMESVYFTLCEFNEDSRSPWTSELCGQQGMDYPGESGNLRRNDMITVIVRLAERLLDLFYGLLPIPIDERPANEQLSSTLGALLPALYDILNMQIPAAGGAEDGSSKKGFYLRELITRVEMASSYKSPLVSLIQLPTASRLQALNQGLRLPADERMAKSLDSLWNTWCEILYFQLEALRLKNMDLVSVARLRRKEIELLMDGGCVAWAKTIKL